MRARFQEYFMGPVVEADVDVIEECANFTVLANVDGVVRRIRLSPCGGEFVWKPAIA